MIEIQEPSHPSFKRVLTCIFIIVFFAFFFGGLLFVLVSAANARPQGEIDPRSIWKDGSKVTTAPIPFAHGLSATGVGETPAIFKTESGDALDIVHFNDVLNGTQLAIDRVGQMLFGSAGSGKISTLDLTGYASTNDFNIVALTHNIWLGSTDSTKKTYIFAGNGDDGFGEVNINGGGYIVAPTLATPRLYNVGNFEVTQNSLLHGNLSVLGTTTLATTLSGIANLASGVVSAITSVQGDLFYASGTNTIAKLAKNTSATRFLSNTGTSNNPAWAQVGPTGIDLTANYAWTGSHTWSTVLKTLDDSSGFWTGGMANDIAVGMFEEVGELAEWMGNADQAAAAFGGSVDSARQGWMMRMDFRVGFPIFTFGLQDNQGFLGSGGTQYPYLMVSSEDGTSGLGFGHDFDTNGFAGQLDIKPLSGLTALFVRNDGGTADIQRWGDSTAHVLAYVDKNGAFSTTSTIHANGAIDSSSTISGTNLYASADSNQIALDSDSANSATITWAGASGARTYTVPDLANGSFVLTSGAQTLTGAKTFSAVLTMSGASLRPAQGTTTVSSIAFTSASAFLSSPVAGDFTYQTDDFYGTISTGTARKNFTLSDAKLTSKRVPVATTNGRLTDDSDMSFDTDTLTITKIAATTFTGDPTISKATPALIFTDSGGDDWKIDVTTGVFAIKNTTDTKTLFSASAADDITLDSVTTTTINVNGTAVLAHPSGFMAESKAAGNEATGAGSAALGTNSPAVTNTAPYTWLKFKTSDGSTVYAPVWK